MTLDVLLGRKYDESTYNCAHFVAEAWELVTGEKIEAALEGFLLPEKARVVDVRRRAFWTKLGSPQSPCLVLMRKKNTPPHVGMFYKRRVAHITPVGVHYQPLDVVTMPYTSVRFYKC